MLGPALEGSKIRLEPPSLDHETLEELGYRQCGLMRRHGFVDGRWYDQWIGDILRDEWEAREENKR